MDFFIKVGEKYLGLQIKPINVGGGSVQLPQIFKERTIQEETHKQFTEVFGGKVFYIYSFKNDGKKEIYNKEVIDAIKIEIDRLAAVKGS